MVNEEQVLVPADNEQQLTQEVVSTSADAVYSQDVQVNQNQAMAPEDIAALKFKQYSSRFELAVNVLTARQAKRVLKNLVLYPLETKALKFTSEEEKTVFSVGDDLLTSKYMMLLYANFQSIQQASELEKQQTEAPTQEQPQENVQENNLTGEKENV